MKRTIGRVLCLTLFLTNCSIYATKENDPFWSEVRQILTPAAAMPKKSKTDISLKNEQSEEEKKKVDLTVRKLSAYEQLDLLLKIREQTDTKAKKRCISPTCLAKLGFVSDQAVPADKATSIAKHLDIKSAVGELELINYATEVKDGRLELRQQAIAYLAQRPELLERLSYAINLIEEGLNGFLHFFIPLTDMEKQLFFESFTFGKTSNLNKNITAMQLLQAFSNAATAATFLPFSAFSVTAAQAQNTAVAAVDDFKKKSLIGTIAKTIGRIALLPLNIAKDVVMTEAVRHSPFPYACSSNALGISIDQERMGKHGLSINDTCTALENEAKMQPGSFLRHRSARVGIALLTPLFMDLIWFANVKQGITVIDTKLEVLNNFYIKLSGVKNIITGLREINAVMQEVYRAVPELRETTASIETLLTNPKNSDLKKLLQELSTSTFNSPWNSSFANKAALLANSAHIVTPFVLMNEEPVKKGLLQPIFEAGVIEVLKSEAQAYAQGANSKTRPVCFVQHVKKDTAYLNLVNFYNPLALNALDKSQVDNVVLNSISLGGDRPNVALVSGQNMGGKTTVAHAAVLSAATLDIAFAEKAEMTPFNINVYGDERGRVDTGNSTFMAEKDRFDEFCKAVETLPAGEFGLTISDEAFSGTTADLRNLLSREGYARLGKHKNSITFGIVHCEEPTKLEAEDPSTFENFYVEVLYDPTAPAEKRFKRTFNLRKGCKTEWFNKTAEQLKINEEYVQWLSQFGRKKQASVEQTATAA